MKLLIVDDQPNVRLLLARILRTLGPHEVAEAANGLEALEHLSRQTVDAVILDLMMPVMDGVETLQAIRRSSALHHLPVIVLSAVRDEGRVRQLVRLGISAYLAKPLRPLDVAERLAELLPELVAGPRPAPRVSPPVPTGAAVLARRRDLRDQMVAATEQVFGMRLGISVGEREGMASPVAGDDLARVRLHLPLEGGAIACELWASRPMSERMTARVLRAGDVVEEAEVAATLRDLVTTISGRLLTTLREQGEQVVASPADVVCAGAEDRPDGAGVLASFASRTEDLRFLTLLRPLAADGAVSAATSAAAARGLPS